MQRPKKIYVFVEGDDDELFVNNIIAPILMKRYSKVTIQKYQEEKKKIVSSILKTIIEMKQEFIFLTDIDNSPCVTQKKNKVIQLIGVDIPTERIFVVVKEIESWYLSGLSYDLCKKMKIKYVGYTDAVFKETFEGLIPASMLRLEFIEAILQAFNIEEAKRRNKSLRYFMEKTAYL